MSAPPGRGQLITEPVSPTGCTFLAEDTMRHKYLEIASTPSVKTARAKYGSAKQYARLDGSLDPDGPVANDRLTDRETAFIAERDSFYIASVSETGTRPPGSGLLRAENEHLRRAMVFRGMVIRSATRPGSRSNATCSSPSVTTLRRSTACPLSYSPE